MDGAQSGSPDFLDLRTRAEFLELCGDFEGARRLVAISLEIAREIDLVCYAYQLMWRERIDDAIALLQYTVRAHPESWNSYHSLAEAFEQKGEYELAIENFREAHNRIDDVSERRVIERRLADLTGLRAAC